MFAQIKYRLQSGHFEKAAHGVGCPGISVAAKVVWEFFGGVFCLFFHQSGRIID